jgi:hypothetical protein
MKRILVYGVMMAVLFVAAVTVLQPVFKAYPLFDVPMHFVGGFLTAGFIDSCLRCARFKRDFLTILLCSIFVWLSWEVLEYFAVIGHGFDGAYDTSKDIVMDTLGYMFYQYVCEFAVRYTDRNTYPRSHVNN